jgi:hypothetical protein
MKLEVKHPLSVEAKAIGETEHGEVRRSFADPNLSSTLPMLRGWANITFAVVTR